MQPAEISQKCHPAAAKEARVIRYAPGMASPPDGWDGNLFRLGPLVIDREQRRAWIGDQPVPLPPGVLFPVLLALAEAWERRPCLAHGWIDLPTGGRHLFHHDDVARLQKHLRDAGCSVKLIESIENVGHRLVRCVWEPRPRKPKRARGAHRRTASASRTRATASCKERSTR